MSRWLCTARIAVLPLAALAAGCGPGYPGEDVVLDSPFEMSQAQRLAALNDVGRQADEKRRWRYALEADCVLAVRQRQGWLGGSTVRVRLDEASVEALPRSPAQGHGVQLVPPGSAAPVTLLRSEGPRPAQQASLLVKLLKRDCTPDEPA